MQFWTEATALAHSKALSTLYPDVTSLTTDSKFSS
jgi:hypothetical protein